MHGRVCKIRNTSKQKKKPLYQRWLKVRSITPLLSKHQQTLIKTFAHFPNFFGEPWLPGVYSTFGHIFIRHRLLPITIVSVNFVNLSHTFSIILRSGEFVDHAKVVIAWDSSHIFAVQEFRTGVLTLMELKDRSLLGASAAHDNKSVSKTLHFSFQFILSVLFTSMSSPCLNITPQNIIDLLPKCWIEG